MRPQLRSARVSICARRGSPFALGAGLHLRSARVSDPAETADRRSPCRQCRPRSMHVVVCGETLRSGRVRGQRPAHNKFNPRTTSSTRTQQVQPAHNKFNPRATTPPKCIILEQTDHPRATLIILEQTHHPRTTLIILGKAPTILGQAPTERLRCAYHTTSTWVSETTGRCPSWRAVARIVIWCSSTMEGAVSGVIGKTTRVCPGATV